MRPCWAYWASKKCTKNKPGIKTVGIRLLTFLFWEVTFDFDLTYFDKILGSKTTSTLCWPCPLTSLLVCTSPTQTYSSKVVASGWLSGQKSSSSPSPPTGLATNSIFYLSTLVKTHWFAWRANQWPPRQGFTFLFCSSQQLPRLRLGPLKGFLSWHGTLQGPSTQLMRCFQNYRDTRTPSGVPR